MARQRSGSSARNTRGSRGAQPASNRPKAVSTTKPPVVADPVEPDEVDEPVVVEAVEVEEPVVVDEPEPEVEAAELAVEDELEDDEDEDDDVPAARSAEASELWDDVRIAPVELALPRMVGYTLRAYRMSNELATVEIDEREDEFAGLIRTEEDEDLLLDEDDEALAQIGLAPSPELRKATTTEKRDAEDDDEFAEDEDDLDAEFDDDELDDEDEDDEASAEADEVEEEDEDEDDDVTAEPEAVVEEVPVFLGKGGKLYLFSTPEQLVEFVRGDEDHDLVQLDSWSDLRERLTPADVVPDDDDRYELDLVVENLRGGADALDLGLMIRAGEAARDIAFATRLEPVIAALAPGSRLDDLDEVVRTVDEGGFKAFLARRKLRRMVTEQTALGWRTIIGKITGVVDWRN